MRSSFLICAISIVAPLGALAETPTSAWTISERVDAFTDEQSFAADVTSTSSGSSFLIFFCDLGGPIKVGLAWQENVQDHAAGKAIPIDWRVGKLKAHTSDWVTEEAISNDTLYVSSELEVPVLSEEMAAPSSASDILRVRMPGSYAEFPLSGFSEAWIELQGKCGLAPR